MKLDDFSFDLPKELIAQTPAKPRNHARLLVYDRSTKKITDDYFYNLNKHLKSKTTLVLNNSKVEKCRLLFGNTELFVIETINPTTIRALVRPGKNFKLGSAIILGPLKALVTEIDAIGIRTLKLGLPINDNVLDAHRFTPLPPYIAQDERLNRDYQTVYAKPLGSKAAPTAGLHFTKAQLARLAANHEIAKLTLHVSLGTFVPIKDDDIDGHNLHQEWYELDKTSAIKLNRAAHITAVGTTSLRTLESLKQPFKASAGTTDIFIKPGHKFHNTDSLITNFHLPKTSLLILVAAFIGSTAELQRVYTHAITQRYRFYSFGDAMLIK